MEGEGNGCLVSVAQADRPHSFSPVWKGKDQVSGRRVDSLEADFQPIQAGCQVRDVSDYARENLKHPWYLRGHRINPTLSLPLGMEEDHVSGHQVDSLEESISAYSSNLLSSGHQAQKHRSRLRLDQIA